MAEPTSNSQTSEAKTRPSVQTAQPAIGGLAPEQVALEQTYVQRALARPSAARPDDILALQRMVGNRAVSRLLSKPAAPSVQAKSTDAIRNNTIQRDNADAGSVSDASRSNGVETAISGNSGHTSSLAGATAPDASVGDSSTASEAPHMSSSPTASPTTTEPVSTPPPSLPPCPAVPPINLIRGSANCLPVVAGGAAPIAPNAQPSAPATNNSPLTTMYEHLISAAEPFGNETVVSEFAHDLAVYRATHLALAEFVQAVAQARRGHITPHREHTTSHREHTTPPRREHTTPPVFDHQRLNALQQQTEEQLATDFRLTMQIAGLPFLQAAQRHLKNGQLQLQAPQTQPRRRRGSTASPPRTAEGISARWQQMQCDQEAWLRRRLERIKHAWMVGKREEARFITTSQPGIAELRNFRPAREVLEEGGRAPIPRTLVRPEDPDYPRIAPEVVSLLLALQRVRPNFRVENRAGHGGGNWAGRGFSLDLYLTGSAGSIDERGFWQPEAAIDFLLALNSVVRARGGRWRVLYNDFDVAQAVNRVTRVRNVCFTGNLGDNPARRRLNWHGPEHMLLHFHLDVELPVRC